MTQLLCNTFGIVNRLVFCVLSFYAYTQEFWFAKNGRLSAQAALIIAIIAWNWNLYTYSLQFAHNFKTHEG